MHQILVYSDSLSWGIIPGTRQRLPFGERWPNILEQNLLDSGVRARVIEDCLNGRRTVWDDPFKPGRNGLQGLAQRIEVNSPLALVILMLGVNDFQFSHPYNNAWSAAQGIAALIREIRNAPVEPGMPAPPVLLVCPPPFEVPNGIFAEKFAGAHTRCNNLSGAYREIATALQCDYFDAASVITASPVDGVHLDAVQHDLLGNALTPVVARIISMVTQSVTGR